MYIHWLYVTVNSAYYLYLFKNASTGRTIKDKIIPHKRQVKLQKHSLILTFMIPFFKFYMCFLGPPRIRIWILMERSWDPDPDPHNNTLDADPKQCHRRASLLHFLLLCCFLWFSSNCKMKKEKIVKKIIFSKLILK